MRITFRFEKEVLTTEGLQGIEPPIKSKKPFIYEWWGIFFKIHGDIIVEEFKKSCKGQFSEEEIKRVSTNMLFKNSFLKEAESNLLDFPKNKGEMLNAFSSMYNLNGLNSLSGNCFTKFQGFNNNCNNNNFNLGLSNFDADFNEFAEISEGLNSGMTNFQNLFKAIGSNLPGLGNKQELNSLLLNVGSLNFPVLENSKFIFC